MAGSRICSSRPDWPAACDSLSFPPDFSPAGTAAGDALRRAGFLPSHAPLVWRAAPGVGRTLDGADLLDALRAQAVPACEVRVRAPGLEALYLDALDGAGLRRTGAVR